MSGDQMFILAFVALLIPMFTTIWMQHKAAVERKEIREEQRAHFKAIAESIDGMKSELVANVRAVAFDDGVNAATPDMPASQRQADLAHDALLAGREATALAAEALQKIKPRPKA